MIISRDGTWQFGNFPGSGSGNTATANVTASGSSEDIVAIVLGASAPNAAYANNDISISGFTKIFEKGVNTSGSNWYHVSAFVLPNAASGAHAVVATNAAGSNNSYGSVWAIPVIGLLTASPVDTDPTPATGGSASPATPSSGVLAQANEFAVAFFSSNTTGVSAGTEPAGFTDQFNGIKQLVGMSLDDQITAATTALSATWTSWITSAFWAAGIVTFKGATATVVTSGGNLDGNMNGNLNGGLYIAHDMREAHRWGQRRRRWQSLKAA